MDSRQEDSNKPHITWSSVGIIMTLKKNHEHHNDIHLIKKSNKRNGAVWFAKRKSNQRDVCTEVVAQEFLRLLNPEQPKTRVILNEEADGLGVMSKDVGQSRLICQSSLQVKSGNSHYGQIEENLLTDVLNKKIAGFGRLCVDALFVYEVDLKLDALALGNNGLIKIDGDCCFFITPYWRQSCDKIYKSITTEDLERLPLVRQFDAYNWIGYKRGGMFCDKRKERYLQLQQQREFQHEIQSEIMRILVLPSELLANMIDLLIPSLAHRILLKKEIQNRQSQLEIAAMQLHRFVEYVAMPKAEEDLLQFIEQLRQHVVIRKEKLNMQKFEPLIREKFQSIRECASKLEHMTHSFSGACL